MPYSDLLYQAMGFPQAWKEFHSIRTDSQKKWDKGGEEYKVK